jgi:hypothetical protein
LSEGGAAEEAALMDIWTELGNRLAAEAEVVRRHDERVLAAWAAGGALTVDVLNSLGRRDPESIHLRDARRALAAKSGCPFVDPWGSGRFSAADIGAVYARLMEAKTPDGHRQTFYTRDEVAWHFELHADGRVGQHREVSHG